MRKAWIGQDRSLRTIYLVAPKPGKKVFLNLFAQPDLRYPLDDAYHSGCANCQPGVMTRSRMTH